MEKNVDGLCTDEMSHLLQSIQHVQPTETHREGQINIEILVEKILNN